MDLKVWRIAKPGHERASANGAQRWNGEGAPVIYAAQSRALAVLEMLGHLEGGELFEAYVIVEIGLDTSMVERVEMSSLPDNWRADPPPAQLKQFGDEWIKRAECPVLRVPSALIPEENNFIVNTDHPEFRGMHFGKPIPFKFDRSLIKDRRC